jgi:hypothetical protein
MTRPKIVIHNHYATRDSAVQVKEGRPVNGKSLVQVISDTGRQIGSGWLDIYTGIYQITSNGSSSRAFKSRNDVENFFEAK